MSVASKTIQILKENELFAKKRFGQNFLISEHVLNEMIAKSGIDSSSYCIEIGTGLGTLTEYLARNSNHVLTYEIDPEVLDVAKSNLSEFSNITYILKDFLECDVDLDISKYLNNSDNITVLANIPYYITTPIAFKLLQVKRINKIYLMMQRELAERFCAKPKTKEYSALSAIIAYFGKAKNVINVKRTCFYPAPNVDSIVMGIERCDNSFNILDEERFFKFIHNMFAQKRKTLVNNLVSSGYSKDKILDALTKSGYKENIRAEEMNITEIVKLYKELVGESK